MKIQPNQWRVKLPGKPGVLHVYLITEAGKIELVPVGYGEIKNMRARGKMRGYPLFFEKWMDANENSLIPCTAH